MYSASVILYSHTCCTYKAIMQLRFVVTSDLSTAQVQVFIHNVVAPEPVS